LRWFFLGLLADPVVGTGDLEPSATGRRLSDSDRPAVRLDDVTNDGETESRSVLASREADIERLLTLRFGYSRSVVFDVEPAAKRADRY